MIETSQPISGPMVSAMIARRGFIHNRIAMQPMMVSTLRTMVTIESVVAWPTCSVLKVSRDSSIPEELRSK